MKNILDFPEAEPSAGEASLAAFIGPGKDYYLAQWARQQEEQALSFHPWAFCFGIVWLLYRQMFRESALFIGLFLALGLLRWSDIGFWLYPDIFFFSRLLLLHLVLGLAANRLYLLYCNRRVGKILAGLEAEEQPAALERQGGVSLLPPAVFLLLALVWFISNYIQGAYGINTNFIF